MKKSDAQRISARIMETLASLEDELGVTFSRGNGSYDEQSFSLKVTATLNNVDGSAQSKEALDFVANAPMYGLSPDDLGKTFISNGKTMTITGMKPRNRKYPIIASSGGRSYKLPASSVKFNLSYS
jgi:hypothetical protein